MSVESVAESLLEKLRTIAQTETVVGEPIHSGDSTIIPVSRISVGMGMGGHTGKGDIASSGGGLRVEPVAFLVLKENDVKVMPIHKEHSTFSKIIDLTPELIAHLVKNFSKKEEKKETKKEN